VAVAQLKNEGDAARVRDASQAQLMQRNTPQP
jgi:hypothetical protein